ncbi:hsp70-like protein [Phytophthora cinnamomi]|uniref:hsp70-like protein n=1 Tax=Phytophthora cinnamomi TaxID=4785 RepID=UPI00355942AD|nr:hsp70-like protein [Phytophthora cinnamomi]
MVDEDAARSLEQEAIALVSLSNPKQFCAQQQQGGGEQQQEQQVALELFVDARASDATSAAVKLEAEASASAAEQQQQQQQQDDASAELLDGNISMKSLLVTLKKRKLQHPQASGSDNGSETAPDDAKLPSFRTVFQPQPQQQQDAAAVAAATDAEPVPPELKCKYRTGKCHNVRALKSCGDYHNLCNYHRLRANANQRKLDRKKKEQRLQQQQLTAGASSPRAATQQPIPASSHAAAAALASLVAAQPQHHFDVLQQQRPLFAAGVTVQEVGKANRNRSTSAASCVRPKQEDACSY